MNKMAAKSFRSQRLISQLKADFAALRNWPSAWSDLLPMTLTSSFQLRFANRLKRWIFDFLIFERHIACINWTSGSTPKVAEMTVIKNASWQIFSLLPLLAFRILLMAKDFKASKLWLFMFLSFPLLCHGFQITLLNLGLL